EIRGMCFIFSMTIIGITLSEHKIMKQQKSKTLKGLEEIHKHDGKLGEHKKEEKAF
ncbi:9465_t:CDS:2, partial [Funneliformis geosporum]